ncbi:hypothetical protein [Pantoea sp. B65]|uniref:hypothetical protein n=1 Tax=Pantoea sp. B65 TaxID=2813359 RepID=UPI0039B6CDEF
MKEIEMGLTYLFSVKKRLITFTQEGMDELKRYRHNTPVERQDVKSIGSYCPVSATTPVGQAINFDNGEGERVRNKPCDSTTINLTACSYLHMLYKLY